MLLSDYPYSCPFIRLSAITEDSKNFIGGETSFSVSFIIQTRLESKLDNIDKASNLEGLMAWVVTRRPFSTNP